MVSFLPELIDIFLKTLAFAIFKIDVQSVTNVPVVSLVDNNIDRPARGVGFVLSLSAVLTIYNKIICLI